MKKKMNILFDEKLINAVRVHECLYDNRCRNYKNLALKGEAWVKIAASLGVSEHECTTRWKSLRDKYTRLLKAEKSSDSALSTKPNWELFENMQFLSDYTKSQETTSSQLEFCAEEETVFSQNTLSDGCYFFTSTNALDAELKSESSSMQSEDKSRKRKSDTLETVIAGPMEKYADSSATTMNDRPYSSVLKRVDALLGGLRYSNRMIAEKKNYRIFV